MNRADRADVVIVGGGPAGMMAGLLFARAGIATLVLEKHGDFFRDFRLRMEAPVEALVEIEGRIAVVRLAGGEEIAAPLPDK